MDTFADRFNIALTLRSISPADMAKRLGISEATISNYRSNKYVPKRPRIEKIAQILNVNVTWLLGYDAPIYTNQSSYAEQLSALFSQMDDDMIRQVLDFARYILSQRNK